MRELRQQFFQHTARVLQKLFAEGASVVRIQRQIADGRFHQVLEEVRAERQVWNVVPFLPRHLDQHGGVVDVGIRDGHTQLDVATAAPASGTDEDELALGQQLVQPADGAADVAHRDMQMIAALHGRIMEQGLVMAYADALVVFGVALFLCMGTVLLLRKPEAEVAVSMAH